MIVDLRGCSSLHLNIVKPRNQYIYLYVLFQFGWIFSLIIICYHDGVCLLFLIQIKPHKVMLSGFFYYCVFFRTMSLRVGVVSRQTVLQFGVLYTELSVVLLLFHW